MKEQAKFLVLILVLVALVLPGCVDSGSAGTRVSSAFDEIFSIGMVDVAYAAEPDYFCDGVDDDVQFQQALDALPSYGGEIIILSANYSFSATVSRAIDSVTWTGVGMGANLTYDDSTTVIDAGSQTGWIFHNFQVDIGSVDISGASESAILGIWIDGVYTFNLELIEVANEPTGFPNRTDSTLSFVNVTRTFSITPVGDSFGYYIIGAPYVVGSADDIVVANTSGVHMIYYDGDTLVEAVNPNSATVEDIMENKAWVATVYWNANDGEAYLLGDERHGTIMSGKTHHWLHDVNGAAFRNGFTISGYTEDTDSDAALTFELTDGTYYDEDLEHSIVDGAPATQYAQQLNGGDAEIPIVYKDDIDGSWTQGAATNLSYMTGGSGRLAYNKDDGDGTFSQVEVTDGKWVSMTLIATNDWQYPIKAIQGQNEYTDKKTAVEEATAEIISFGGGSLSPEVLILYRFVLMTKDTFGGTKKAKIEVGGVTDFRTATILSGAPSASSHGALSGLANDDHAQYLLDSIVDAKGDVLVATADDIIARLAVGINGQVLTAESGTTTGLNWTTVAGGGAEADTLDTVYERGSVVQVDVADVVWNIASGKDYIIQDAGTTIHTWGDNGEYDVAIPATQVSGIYLHSAAAYTGAASSYGMRIYRTVGRVGYQGHIAWHDYGIRAEVLDNTQVNSINDSVNSIYGMSFESFIGTNLLGTSNRSVIAAYGFRGIAFRGSSPIIYATGNTSVYCYGGHIDGSAYPLSWTGSGYVHSYGYGLWARGNSQPVALGEGASGYSYGVWGEGLGNTQGTSVSYGIYGTAGGANTNWAGYFAGNVYVTGKIDAPGGFDPAYVLYDVETRQSIIDMVNADVPFDKLDGAMMFYNGDTRGMETFVPSLGEFRDFNGKLLATVSPITDTFDTVTHYYLDTNTGEILSYEAPVKIEYHLGVNVTLDVFTGKLYRPNEETGRTEEITKEQAVVKKDPSVEVKTWL